jgi:hypothetical protein
MTDLDASWRVYARLQLQSRRRSRLDAFGWGIEAALDHLLSLRAGGTLTDHAIEANEALARGKARERHRTRLRAHYLDPHEVDNPLHRLDDRARLREAMKSVDKSERQLLLATGFGHSSGAISGHLLIKPAAVRKRVDRLRRRLTA